MHPDRPHKLRLSNCLVSVSLAQALAAGSRGWRGTWDLSLKVQTQALALSPRGCVPLGKLRRVISFQWG